jgi:hypothetical protein
VNLAIVNPVPPYKIRFNIFRAEQRRPQRPSARHERVRPCLPDITPPDHGFGYTLQMVPQQCVDVNEHSLQSPNFVVSQTATGNRTTPIRQINNYFNKLTIHCFCITHKRIEISVYFKIVQNIASKKVSRCADFAPHGAKKVEAGGLFPGMFRGFRDEMRMGGDMAPRNPILARRNIQSQVFAGKRFKKMKAPKGTSCCW